MSSSSSTVSQKPSINIENIRQSLECPINLEPLYDAVTLVPCAHKISEIAAKKLFGPANPDSRQVAIHASCPLCKRIVGGYLIDHAFRELVLSLLPIKPSLQTDDQQRRQTHPPFPGEAAYFIHKMGNWDFFDARPENPNCACREIHFRSISPNSIFQGFSVFGYKQGSITLWIDFNPLFARKLDAYLTTFDIHLDGESLLGGMYKERDISKIRILFDILSQNNSIPDFQLPMLREIIERGHV